MTQIEAFTTELEKEAISTRKMLSVIPTDKFGWQPHEKSMTIKRLAIHIAELHNWIGLVFNANELDFENNTYVIEDANTTEELLAYFERCLEDGRKNLKLGKEDTLTDMWSLRSGAAIYLTESKWQVIRVSLSQIIHHRAQLGVYLRLLDVKIPGSYGPSADETF